MVSPKQGLRNVPRRATTFVFEVFAVVLRRQYLPPWWKRSRDIRYDTKEKPLTACFLFTQKCAGRDSKPV